MQSELKIHDKDELISLLKTHKGRITVFASEIDLSILTLTERKIIQTTRLESSTTTLLDKVEVNTCY